MTKFVLFFIGWALVIGAASGLQCYLCDDYNNKNCEGQTWPKVKCRYSCATYQALVLERPDRHLYDSNTTRHKRGCGGYRGCNGIKEDFYKAWQQVYDTDCKECTTDLCNDRANHPGYKYNPVNTWDY